MEFSGFIKDKLRTWCFCQYFVGLFVTGKTQIVPDGFWRNFQDIRIKTRLSFNQIEVRAREGIRHRHRFPTPRPRTEIQQKNRSQHQERNKHGEDGGCWNAVFGDEDHLAHDGEKTQLKHTETRTNKAKVCETLTGRPGEDQDTTKIKEREREMRTNCIKKHKNKPSEWYRNSWSRLDGDKASPQTRILKQEMWENGTMDLVLVGICIIAAILFELLELLIQGDKQGDR